MARLHAPLYDGLGLSGGMAGAGSGKSVRIFLDGRDGTDRGSGIDRLGCGDLLSKKIFWKGRRERSRLRKMLVGGLDSCFRTGKIKVER